MDEVKISELTDPSLSEYEARERIAEYCRIDLSNLEQALARQPALYAYCVAAYEFSRVEEARAKWKVEFTKAEVFKVVSDADPKITISAADKKIPLATTTKQAMDEWHRVQVTAARLRALCAGLEHRRDMLVQISARQRQEMAS